MLNNIFYSAAVLPDWVTASFPIIRIVLIILMTLISIALVIAVMIQPASSDGLGALGGQSSDTYYSKNKQDSLEGFMKKVTIILGISAAVISIIFFITLVIYPAF